MQAENSQLRELVGRLPADVVSMLERQHRQLTADELAGLIQTLISRTGKRPIVQVNFDWKTGEPKDKPFIVKNCGDEEARNVCIAPIVLGRHQLTFVRIGQLSPGETALRAPQPGSTVGFFFRTLIDVFHITRDERVQELYNEAPPSDPPDLLGHSFDAAHQARIEFLHVPVTVTYADRHDQTTTLHYQLNVEAFADVTHIRLDLS